jgi:holliday junction DNA helicase RuvA
MIYYLKGLLAFKSPTFVVVDVGGVGYQVHISLHTYAKIEKLESLRLLTYPVIKEDSHTLFGFAEEEERFLFTQLLTVSGIGSNTARLICSSLAPEEIRRAIIGEDELAFRNVKGIGTKTAKQIILDLKNKIIKDSGESEGMVLENTGTMDTSSIKQEALAALQALGFPRQRVSILLNKIWSEKGKHPITVEGLIKETLKQLS